MSGTARARGRRRRASGSAAGRSAPWSCRCPLRPRPRPKPPVPQHASAPSARRSFTIPGRPQAPANSAAIPLHGRLSAEKIPLISGVAEFPRTHVESSTWKRFSSCEGPEQTIFAVFPGETGESLLVLGGGDAGKVAVVGEAGRPLQRRFGKVGCGRVVEALYQ